MIVAGFGFTTSASADSLRQALHATGYVGVPDHLATAQDKAGTPTFRQFAESLPCHIIAVPVQKLTAMTTQTQSAHSHTTRNTGSVAEAAALAAAGPGATLICARVISPDRKATCAIAKGPDT
ncbi:cobalamin biosynthesis protein [uncultured Tateyamaria sp.]|uniref:cobalamin biosynthesis protein n=1 Tax=uncultured Tateyamaria sp. TaxID=455651 RepID=UPI00261C40AA|nr:cobalamin biosynthesis protein [uncultured Tateyamaria sp.]